MSHLASITATSLIHGWVCQSTPVLKANFKVSLWCCHLHRFWSYWLLTILQQPLQWLNPAVGKLVRIPQSRYHGSYFEDRSVSKPASSLNFDLLSLSKGCQYPTTTCSDFSFQMDIDFLHLHCWCSHLIWALETPKTDSGPQRWFLAPCLASQLFTFNVRVLEHPYEWLCLLWPVALHCSSTLKLA